MQKNTKYFLRFSLAAAAAVVTANRRSSPQCAISIRLVSPFHSHVALLLLLCIRPLQSLRVHAALNMHVVISALKQFHLHSSCLDSCHSVATAVQYAHRPLMNANVAFSTPLCSTLNLRESERARERVRLEFSHSFEWVLRAVVKHRQTIVERTAFVHTGHRPLASGA